jgi:hypothetical protein
MERKGCTLDCQKCPTNIKRNCGFGDLNAFLNTGGNRAGEVVIHTHTAAQLRTRVDAKKAAKNIKGTSGGTYGGIPPAIETPPDLYVIDQLKSEKARGGK